MEVPIEPDAFAPRGTPKSYLWLLPLGLAVLYVFAVTLLPGWTWSLYDELSWVDIFRKNPSVWRFTAHDFEAYGRVRPLSAAFVFAKFSLLGLRPHLLRLERVAEWACVAGLAMAFLARHMRLPLALAAFGVAFWLKSPPQLEQLRWMTLSELNGELLLLSGLLLWRRSRPAAYACLCLGALTKEPFAIFLPLPAILWKKHREALAAAAASAAWLGFLYLQRKSYTADAAIASSSAAAAREILAGGLKDLAPLALAALLVKGIKKGDDSLWRALACAVFAAVYAATVLSKAWGYTYILAPALLLLGLAAAFALAGAELRASRLSIGILALLVAAFSFRIGWNWSRNYARTKQRAELIEAVTRASPQGGSAVIATNCPLDARGIAYAAGFRVDGPSCTDAAASIQTCCARASLLALGQECWEAPRRITEARLSGYEELFANDGWALFKCP